MGEASVVEGLDVIPVSNLKEVVSFLNRSLTVSPVKLDIKSDYNERVNEHGIDFAKVKGQEAVKRALLIASAGNHNLRMIYKV